MNEWFRQPFAQRIVALLLLVGVLLLLKDVLNLLLLTFLFAYLFYSVHSLLMKKLPKWAKKSEKAWYVLLYFLFLLSMAFIGYRYAPVVATQLGDIMNQVINFQWDDILKNLPAQVADVIKDFNIGTYIKESGTHIITAMTDVSTFLIQLFIALLLSFFFVVEKDSILSFLRRFQSSKMSFLYDHYAYFFHNFIHTFGTVLKIQLIISLINTTLSVIALSFMGFPHILGLAFLIFILGLIPVAGVFVSLIPLSLIAFKIGGLIKIVHVLIMVMVVHAIESYALNPKLYSMQMKLPVFFTFLILIVSEHLLGVWGLLIGVPLFMFLLDILGVSLKGKKVK